jgi:hypothetical protein
MWWHEPYESRGSRTDLREARGETPRAYSAILEGQFPDVVELQPAILAQHWTEAGSIERAIASWTKAGQASLARSAVEETVVQSRKGLALLPALAEGRQRSRQEFELRAALGWALSF